MQLVTTPKQFCLFGVSLLVALLALLYVAPQLQWVTLNPPAVPKSPGGSPVMILALLFTLALPAGLASLAARHEKLCEGLTSLALGLVLQIVGEILTILALGRSLLPLFEGPWIAIRLIQLFSLIPLVGAVDSHRLRRGIQIVLGANLILWTYIFFRLLARLERVLS